MKTLSKLLPVLVAGATMQFLAGCASIVKGTTQAIPVTTSPTGATVKLDGNVIGQTPTNVEAKRKGDHLLTFEKEGYQPESVAITRNIGGAVFGNIIAGGLVGWGVDAISGAQYNLSPKTVSLTLRPVVAGEKLSTERSDAVIFIEELKKLDGLHEGRKISDEEYAKMRTALVARYGHADEGPAAASVAPASPASGAPAAPPAAAPAPEAEAKAKESAASGPAASPAASPK